MTIPIPSFSFNQPYQINAILQAYTGTESGGDQTALWNAFLAAQGITSSSDLPTDQAGITALNQKFLTYVQSTLSQQTVSQSPGEMQKRAIMGIVFNTCLQMLNNLQQTVAVQAQNLIFLSQWQNNYTSFETAVPIYTPVTSTYPLNTSSVNLQYTTSFTNGSNTNVTVGSNNAVTFPQITSQNQAVNWTPTINNGSIDLNNSTFGFNNISLNDVTTFMATTATPGVVGSGPYTPSFSIAGPVVIWSGNVSNNNPVYQYVSIDFWKSDTGSVGNSYNYITLTLHQSNNGSIPLPANMTWTNTTLYTLPMSSTDSNQENDTNSTSAWQNLTQTFFNNLYNGGILSSNGTLNIGPAVGSSSLAVSTAAIWSQAMAAFHNGGMNAVYQTFINYPINIPVNPDTLNPSTSNTVTQSISNDNAQLQQFIENIRTRSQSVQNAQQTETANLSNTREAVSQESNIIQGIFTTATAIVNAIVPGASTSV